MFDYLFICALSSHGSHTRPNHIIHRKYLIYLLLIRNNTLVQLKWSCFAIAPFCKGAVASRWYLYAAMRCVYMRTYRYIIYIIFIAFFRCCVCYGDYYRCMCKVTGLTWWMMIMPQDQGLWQKTASWRCCHIIAIYTYTITFDDKYQNGNVKAMHKERTNNLN